MIKNYLRSAIRNITRHKFIAFINIFGLTIGLTCCILILIYIVNELSYDRFNTNAKNIYRVTRSFNTTDGVQTLHLGCIAPPFGPLLKNEFSDIKKVTRLRGNGNLAMRYKDKLLNESGSYFADENFFDVFTVKTIKGDPATALSDPFTVMMTEDMARKYFGDEDPMNKEIRLGNLFNFKVTGIYKPFPKNSQLHPEMLLSFITLKDSTLYGDKQLHTNWGNNDFFTYLLLPENYNINRLESLFPAFLDKYVHGPGQTGKESKNSKLHIQKLLDIHLHSHLDAEIEANGDIKRVYVFSAIALFILLIACINYMNLSTARSMLRAKEIGIRKVIGAQQKEIITQFLSESVLITSFSLVLALVLSWLLIPLVNKFSDLSLTFNTLYQPAVLIPVLILPIVVGLISGIYPAIFMSSFKPVKVLKGIFKVGSGNISFRKVLVVLQFSISIVLIVATTIVFQQLRYMQQKSLGFDKEHIITMDNPFSDSQFDAFRNEVMKNANVKEVGRSSRVPSGRLLDDQGISVFEGNKSQPVKTDVKYVNADYGFIPTFGMKMSAGRNFSRDFGTDSSNYIVNAAAVKVLGWKTPENAIGKDLSYGGVKGKVIGVVNDFHFESLHQNIIPLLFRMPANTSFRRLSIKIGGSNIGSAIGTIQDAWRKSQPEIPFEYTFLDERFQKLYSSEQQQSHLFTIFSCIAIFIACLGLFGLSAFTITQRVKEIGVRKVLGASIPQIVTELSKDFLKLVLIASIIALPVAWYAMNKWLLDFAFRISIQWWVFVMAGVLAVIIAFATISYQSIKAAIANPVKSLRSE